MTSGIRPGVNCGWARGIRFSVISLSYRIVRLPLLTVIALGFPRTLAAQDRVAPIPPRARGIIDLGAGATARFDVRQFELAVGRRGVGGDSAVDMAGATELRLTKAAGPLTSRLVQQTSAGERFAAVTLEALDSLGAVTLTIRLTDVIVVGDRLSLSTTRPALEQQRIALQETLTQLSTDYTDAQQQLAVAEQLGKNRTVTPMELARARARETDLRQRLALARQRHALVQAQLALQGPVDEELTLKFAHIDVETPTPSPPEA